MKRLFYAALIVLPFGKVLSIPLMESNGKLISLFPFDVLSGCLAIVCLMRYWTRPHASSGRLSIAVPVAIFLLWTTITLPLNAAYFHLSLNDTFFGSLYLMRWAQYVAFYYAAVEIVAVEPMEAEKLVKYMAGGALAFSLFGILQSIALPDFAFVVYPEARPNVDFDLQGHRLVSTFLDPNITAGYIVFFAILALSFYMSGYKRWLVPFLTFFLALVVTLSRGGLLGFLVGAAVLAVVTGGVKARRAMAAAVALILVLAIALYPVLAPELVERERVSLTDASAIARVEDWLVAINMVRDNPVTGIGFDNFGFVSPRYGLQREGGLAFGFGGDLLVILTLTGTVGLLLYLWIYVRAFRAMRTVSECSNVPHDRALALGIMAGMAGMLASSSFTTIILYPQIMAIIWTCLGIVYARLGAVPESALSLPQLIVAGQPTLRQAFRQGLRRRLATSQGANSA